MSKNTYLKKEEMKKQLIERARSSFLDIGLSMDEHLYNFEKLLHKNYCNQESLEFLKKLHSFYCSLNQFEKMVFINDYLESGRHYRFWYIGVKSRTIYFKTVNKIYKELKEKIYVA